MKFLRILGLAGMLLGVVGLLGSTIARQVYSTQAALIQRVTVADPDLAALTGDATNPIGEPQMLIISDPKAFVAGTGPRNSRLVDDDYLKSNGIYPLQLKTVHFVANSVALGAAIVSIVGIGLLLFVKSRACKLPAVPELKCERGND